MTTKQILFSALILGSVVNNALSMLTFVKIKPRNLAKKTKKYDTQITPSGILSIHHSGNSPEKNALEAAKNMMPQNMMPQRILTINHPLNSPEKSTLELANGKIKLRPDETLVLMGRAKSIMTERTEDKPLIISTFGLGGCIATALHIKYNNGQQYAGITHYPPFSISEQISSVRKLWQDAIAQQDETKQITVINTVVTVPGNWVKNNDKWEFLVRPEYQTYCTTLNSIPSDISTCKKIKWVDSYCIPYSINEITSRDISPKPRDFEVILNKDKSTIALNKSYTCINV